MTKGTACEARMLAHATAFNWDAWAADFDRRMAEFHASLERSRKLIAEMEGRHND